MNSLPPYVTWPAVDAIIKAGLEEDLGSGDATTEALVEPGVRAFGSITAKQEGILAGIQVAERVFGHTDPAIRVDWLFGDGMVVREGAVVARLTGPAPGVLAGERLALNFLQRMSGIASATAAIVRTIKGTSTTLLDTRKTAPGLRILDKWAVLLGGGANHRVGLYDMILIKENHLAAAGGVTAALEKATARAGRQAPALRIEIEVSTMHQLEEVLSTELAHRVMLDNFITHRPDGSVDTDLLARAVHLVDGRIETEASGNITLASARAIAETGVDFISSGALTHSAKAMDFSLLIDLK